MSFQQAVAAFHDRVLPADHPTIIAPPTSAFEPTQDYRIIHIAGVTHSLSPTQAKVIRILHEAWLSGKPDVTMKTIQLEVEEAPVKMSNLFRRTDPRSILIKRVRADIYRLGLPG